MDRIPVYKSLHAEKTIMGLPTFTFYFLIVFSVAILIILKSLLAIIPILFIVFVIKYISIPYFYKYILVHYYYQKKLVHRKERNDRQNIKKL